MNRRDVEWNAWKNEASRRHVLKEREIEKKKWESWWRDIQLRKPIRYVSKPTIQFVEPVESPPAESQHFESLSAPYEIETVSAPLQTVAE